MDKDAIERIRTATFPIGRRGYEKRDVERFLDQVADWLETGAGDESRSDSVRTELERIGQHTTNILTEAHAAAEKLKEEAQREVARIHSEADAYAERVRIDAETYAREQREEADSYGDRQRSQIEVELGELRRRADQELERLEQTTARRRAQLEAEVADLEERRHEAVDRMRRLSSLLAGTATEHDAPLRERSEGGPEAVLDELAEAEADADPYAVRAGDADDEEPALEEDAGETMEFDVEREFVRRDEEGPGPA